MILEHHIPHGERCACEMCHPTPWPFQRKRGDEGTGGPVATPATRLVPGVVYQLGRKALAVEIRDGEPVLVQLAEAPR